jgi:hypothetical protein
MSEYTLEHYKYVKGLHTRIAELERDKDGYKNCAEIISEGYGRLKKEAEVYPQRIAELEADKAELVEGLKCAEHFSTCLLNYCGHATTEEDDNTLYSMDLLITKHQQLAKEQGE